MTTENQNLAPSLIEIKGEIADAELDKVSGGDAATTTKTTTKTTPPIKPFVITIMDANITSYSPG